MWGQGLCSCCSMEDEPRHAMACTDTEARWEGKEKGVRSLNLLEAEKKVFSPASPMPQKCSSYAAVCMA